MLRRSIASREISDPGPVGCSYHHDEEHSEHLQVDGIEVILKKLKELQKLVDIYREEELGSELRRMIFRALKNLCKSKPGKTLYNDVMKEFLKTSVLQTCRKKEDTDMLKELVECWSTYKVLVRCFSLVYIQVADTVNTYTLEELIKIGFTLFRCQVRKKFIEKVRCTIFSMIGKQREGEKMDHDLVKHVLQMLIEFGMEFYEREFGAQMFSETLTYYLKKALRWIPGNSFSQYMKKVEICLEHEKEMVSLYPNVSSELKLIEKLGYELIMIYADNVPETEHSRWDAMLKDVKLKDLARMYRLLSGTPQGSQLLSTTQCLHLLRITSRQYVIDEVTPCIKQVGDLGNNKVQKRDVGVQREVLLKIIELHDKHFKFVKKQCKGECFKEVCDAYVFVFNEVVDGSSMAKFLADVADDIVKKGQSMRLSDERIQIALRKVALFVFYFEDKDLFAVLYRNKVAYQLLYDKTDSNFRNLIYFLTKIKIHLGSHLTYKMQRMVSDRTLADETQLRFMEYICEKSFVNPGIDFSVSVLSAWYWPYHWPFSKYRDLKLPTEMTECIKVYSEFYNEETKDNKRLKWMNTLGTCTIEGDFDRGIIHLDMTTAQACVLQLFNSRDRLTIEEISTELNILDDEYLVGILHSLSCAKYKILTKVSSSETISKSDCFEYNSAFTSESMKIKITFPPVRTMKADDEVEMARNDKNNKIDLTIMSIMKKEKKMEFGQLKSECVRKLGNMFKLKNKEFKMRIEELLERNFIARDSENGNLIIYVP